MRERHLYDYAVIRVVPRPERGEFVNAGVLLSCPTLRYLDAGIALEASRLQALCPDVDLDLVREHLAAIPLICAGGAAAGPIGRLTQRERFQWLAAARSTMIQASPIHTGRCSDPPAALARLVDTLVRCPERRV